jgi:hypothetical protein
MDELATILARTRYFELQWVPMHYASLPGMATKEKICPGGTLC